MHSQRVSSRAITDRTALLDCAERSGKDSIPRSFHPTYLDKVLETASGEWTNEEIVRRLELALEARKEVHDIERNMDNAIFERLVTNGSCMLSGKDRSSHKPLMWIDSGEFHRGCWRCSRGTRAFNAHLRAQVWMMEVAEHLAARNGFNGHIIFSSEKTHANLDTNCALFAETARLLNQQFPFTMFAKEGFTARIAGLSWGLSVISKILASISGKDANTFLTLIDYEDATGMVEDPCDIPEFWYDDGNGKFSDETCLDVGTAWCYKRCMSEGSKISLQEVLSPMECLENVDNEPLHSSCKKHALESIAEIDGYDDVRTNKARVQPTPLREFSHPSDPLADRPLQSSYKNQERRDILESITEEEEEV